MLLLRIGFAAVTVIKVQILVDEKASSGFPYAENDT